MKLKNEIFAFVLDWLVKNKGVDGQKGLSQITGISQNTVSRIMTGKVEPSDDTLRKLNDAFGGIFNMNYLRGISTVMFIEDEMYYAQHPDEHPLYEKKEPAAQIPDMSSVFNAALAAKDETITTLKDMIASLKSQIADKDELLEHYRRENADLRSQIANSGYNYPFPHGVADDKKDKRMSK
jgi:transcriptional regulator with XRE-family HTH domain